MTALEKLYKQYIEEKRKPMEEFYNNFRDDCPSTFFKSACDLCHLLKKHAPLELCAECWVQWVDD